jgi:hypothetical protein
MQKLISLSIGIVSQSITGIESVIKIGSNRDVLLDRASKCVGLFIILTNPLMTRMSLTL